MKQGTFVLSTLLIATFFGCSGAGTGDGPLAEGTAALTSVSGQYGVTGNMKILDSAGATVATITLNADPLKTSHEVALRQGDYTVTFDIGYQCSDMNPPMNPNTGMSQYIGCEFLGSNPSPFHINAGIKTNVALNFRYNYNGQSTTVVFSAGSAAFSLEGSQSLLCGGNTCTPTQTCATFNGHADACYDACTTMVTNTLNQGSCSVGQMCIPVLSTNGESTDLSTLPHICVTTT